MSNLLIRIGIAALIIFLASGWLRSCQSERATQKQYEAATDKLTKTVDALGRANFETKSIEGSYMELRTLAFENDTTLKRLRAALSEKGKRDAVRAAVSFDATAKGKASGKSYVSAAYTRPAQAAPLPLDSKEVWPVDSANQQGRKVYPKGFDDSLVIRGRVASKKFDPTKPPTIEAEVVARRDSVFLDPYFVRVGFDVLQTEAKGSITTTIRPTDPNIEVTSARSFTKKLPKKNRGFWAGVGAAAVLVLTLAL